MLEWTKLLHILLIYLLLLLLTCLMFGHYISHNMSYLFLLQLFLLILYRLFAAYKFNYVTNQRLTLLEFLLHLE